MSFPISPRLLAIAVSLAGAASLPALDSFAVGPRALGMGGTGVACVNDIQAQYYNPAMFGFFSYSNENGERASADNQNLRTKTWGFGLDATVGLQAHDHFLEYANTLKKVYDSNLVQNVENGSYTLTPADVQNLTNFASALQGIDKPEEYATVDLNGGFGLRIMHFGIGVRTYGEVLGRVSSIDFKDIGANGIQNAAQQVNTALGNPSLPTLPVSGTTPITPAQQTILNGLGITNVGQLNALATQAGVTTDQIQSLLGLLQLQQAGVGTGGSVKNNTTTVMLRGVLITELPLSYGYAFNDHLSVGGNIKYQRGRLYGADIRIFDDSAKDTLRNARDSYSDTSTIGLDLGVCARTDMLQAGIVGRNLTRPKFKGFDATSTLSSGTTITSHIDDYVLDPSAAAGVAFIPARWFTLAADLDLTRNKTIFPDYKTQNLGVGAELNILYVLALRAGLVKNLAESDIGLLYTAGVGLNLWLLRMDLAGEMSKSTTVVDDRNVPREARVALQLAVDF